MTYKVVIRRNSDGRKHVCKMPDSCKWVHPGENKASPEYDTSYWWLEGNGACDCNRKRFFDNVADEDAEDTEEACPCGEGEYSVLEVRLNDGRVIKLET